MGHFIRLSLSLAFIFLLSLPQAKASHIFGGDFFYTHLSGNTYRITLVLYGDCSGSAFTSLPTSVPRVVIYKGASFQDSLLLQNTGPYNGVEVSPVCPSELGNTTCNTGGYLPGVKQFTYSATYTLSGPAANWRFLFTGFMGNAGYAGRSNAITNLVISGPGGGGSTLTLEATLNNVNGPNSSPQFTTLPTPFYCINTSQQYNQGAVDADGDQLLYSLSAALEPNGGPATYVSGYSPVNPLRVAPGSFGFNPNTGQLSFIPNLPQNSVVVNKVVERRDGVQVGSAMREMTFIVLNDCNNEPPTASLSTATISGGAADTVFNIVYVCPGTPLLDIHLFPTDPNGDVVTVSSAGLPEGATLTVAGNGTTNPDVNFQWNTAGVPSGNYTFYLNYADNGCPLSSRQTIAYVINIGNELTISPEIIAPTQCYHKAAVQYNIANGAPPYFISITSGGAPFQSITTSSASHIDSLPAGTYEITVTAGEGGCTTEPQTLVIVDSGALPLPVLTNESMFCTGAPSEPLTVAAAPGATINWLDAGGTPLPGAPTPNTAVAGVTQYLVRQFIDVCQSGTDTITVYVTDQPAAAFTLSPETPCSRTETTQVTFTGAIGSGPFLNFNWNWDGGIADSTGPLTWTVMWPTGGVKNISLTVVENGCASLPATNTAQVRATPVPDFTVTKACVDQPVRIQYNAATDMGQSFMWQFDNDSLPGSTAEGPFAITYRNAGEKTISLMVSANGCADSSEKIITVFPSPTFQLPTLGGAACVGDIVLLPRNSNTQTYVWEPADKVFYEPDGQPFIRIMEPITFTGRAVNQYGCVDSGVFAFNEVAPCCTFSFPSAFTPNGDGKNDQFRVILYGNEQSYELQIYNRWGQQVFLSRDPAVGWDGTYNGVPQDIGVYFYRVRGKCITGQDLESAGELTLLR